MTSRTAYDRLISTAIALATAVSVDDRIAKDPAYPADRSPRADRLRIEARATDLAKFRAALADFDAEVAA